MTTAQNPGHRREDSFRTFIRNSPLYRKFSLFRDYKGWAERRFSAPSPHYIKQTCLLRNGLPDATWVETGTYLGQTTEVLARNSPMVYSIEPEPTLYENARRYFESFSNVRILNGLSEQVFPTLLPGLEGDVNFWLDGHYSAGPTFKGPQDTPILDELACIAENLPRYRDVRILIDDIRCFDPTIPEYATYPSLDVLVDWARRNRLSWHIEHDIFIARR